MVIRDEIAVLDEEMRNWRHDLHAHPELGFHEHRTSAFVADQLRSFGVDRVETGIAGTGVVGVIHGRRPRSSNDAPSIGLRADMDALPIMEENDLPYRSRSPGVMHACGHDGHTAMLLGAAKYLARSRNFSGTVNLIFQPAEEGIGGAQRMIDEGLFARFPCDSVYGMHNWPELPVGQFSVRAGAVMAAADTFSIMVRGKGAHGALPHHGADPVLAGSAIVSALQAIVSRNIDPAESAVVSVTQFHAGTADNVIPAEAVLRGTARCFSQKVRAQIEQRMAEVAESIARAHRTTVDFTYVRHMSPTINSEAETAGAAAIAASVAGAENVLSNVPPSMGAEDFAEMLKIRPGTYVWLGQGRGPDTPMVHTSRYDFDDEILSLGASYWVALAEQLLPNSR
ncbi:hippurate hydrolase [Rhodoligotrophos appendicifer]|uniref:M20 aminoacylase family protein n=1 Tax=Rhodoligotrophos appendicifer TaxID=987056 RepID=UPI001186C245|nr:M20 aminoacylase family protein [Rhodoligotrophos appendicifer]